MYYMLYTVWYYTDNFGYIYMSCEKYYVVSVQHTKNTYY